MKEVVLRVENLGKKYRIQHQAQRQRYKTLRDLIAEKLASLFRRKDPRSRSATSEDFWALEDVSFEIGKGEVAGIIGRNGAGKSTLLKILSRITEPTKGRVCINGRVASLLEVGTGFHPELTGRENVFLNGAILGMHRAEIKRKFDEIVAFAEVEKFLDTPVKRYSSGMYVRLAFAVAAHLEPEILIVDEVLAVGDAQFQKKCLGKMQDISNEQGRAVLFVSHNMAAVQQLTRTCLFLQKGRIIGQGRTSDVLAQYFNSESDLTGNVYPIQDIPNRICCGKEIEFLKLELTNPAGRLIPSGEPVRIRLTIKANQSVGSFRFGITIFQINGTPVGNTFTAETLSIAAGATAGYDLDLANTDLAPGKYFCGVSIGTGNHETSIKDFDIVLEVLHFEVVPPSGAPVGTWNPNWGAVCFPTPVVKHCGENGRGK